MLCGTHTRHSYFFNIIGYQSRRAYLRSDLFSCNSGYTKPIFAEFVLFVFVLLTGARYGLLMGVGIEVWRGRIGIFYNAGTKYKRANCSTRGLCFACHWLRPLSLILALLAIGCVELNPGPRNDEVMQRLDDLAREFRDMRAALSTKLDDAVCNLTDKMKAYDIQLAAVMARLDGVDRILATNATELVDVRAQLTALPTGATTPTPPIVSTAATAISPVSINEVVREIDRRSSKKANIVVSGLNTSTTNDNELNTVVADLLRNELNITATVSKCTRLGKPGIRFTQTTSAVACNARG